MDAIAGAAFGIHVDSLKNPRDAFASHGADTLKTVERLFPLYGRLFFFRRVPNLNLVKTMGEKRS